MSNRPRSGDFDTRPVAIRTITPREYVNRYFPPGSLLAEPTDPPPFNLAEREPSTFSLIEGFLLSFLTGIAFVAAAYILLFIES